MRVLSVDVLNWWVRPVAWSIVLPSLFVFNLFFVFVSGVFLFVLWLFFVSFLSKTDFYVLCCSIDIFVFQVFLKNFESRLQKNNLSSFNLVCVP